MRINRKRIIQIIAGSFTVIAYVVKFFAPEEFSWITHDFCLISMTMFTVSFFLKED